MKKKKKEILAELKILEQQIIFLSREVGKVSIQQYKEKTIKVSKKFLDLYNMELLHSENSIPNCISQTSKAYGEECYMTFKDFS